MHKQLKYLFYLTIAPLIVPSVVVFTFAVFLINETIRTFISFYFKYREKGLIKLAESGSDAIWGYKKPFSSRNVIVYCVAQKGFFTRNSVHKIFAHGFDYQDGQIRPYEKFQWILTTRFGFICWKKHENYNLWNQIRTWNNDTDNNQSQDNIIPEQDLIDGLSDLEKDMDESKPQWELITIPRIQGANEEKSAVVVRFNHAYLDGLSFVMFLKERLGVNMTYTIDPMKFTIPRWKKFLFYTTAILYGPAYSVQMFISKSLKTPWVTTKTPPGQKRQKNFAKTDSIPSSLIKKIQLNSPGKVTINDVVALALITSLKKVLPRHKLVAELRIGTILAMLPYPNFHPRNRFTNYSYKINTQKQLNTHEDISQMLQQINRRSLRGLLGPQSLMCLWGFDFYGRFPTWATATIMSGAYDSLYVSNVPVSKGKAGIIFGGVLEEISAWPPQPNDTGISVAVVGYNDTLKITGSADTEWLTKPELDKVFQLIPQEIQRMADLCPFNEATWRLPSYYKDSKPKLN